MKKRIKKMNRLSSKYGVEIFKDFKDVKNIPYFTLANIAKKFGFTKEYARQLYNFLYLDSYTNAHAKKMATVKDIQCSQNPSHGVSEYKKNGPVYQGVIVKKIFIDKCANFGFDVSILCKRGLDMVVNGWIINVKSCKKLAPVTKYHRFKVSAKQRSLCDFFAMYSHHQQCFFIIPNKDKGIFFDTHRFYYISETEKNQKALNADNKYYEFKNNFEPIGIKYENL